MSFGDKGIYTIDPDYVPKTPFASVSLFNNLWTINFPYWIRARPIPRPRLGDARPQAGEPDRARPGSPPCRCWSPSASGPAGKLPATASGLALSRPGVRLTHFAPNRDGDGTVLRLWEQNGDRGKVIVTLPKPCPFTKALPVNLRGEKIGEPVAIKNGRFAFNIGAYAPASFALTPELPSAAPPTFRSRNRQAPGTRPQEHQHPHASSYGWR